MEKEAVDKYTLGQHIDSIVRQGKKIGKSWKFVLAGAFLYGGTGFAVYKTIATPIFKNYAMPIIWELQADTVGSIIDSIEANFEDQIFEMEEELQKQIDSLGKEIQNKRNRRIFHRMDPQ